MFKKIFLASALVLSTTQVASAGFPYLGISTGVATTTTSFSNFRGLPGTFFAGYGGILGQGVYIAGEIFGTPLTGTITSDNGLKSTYNYGLSVLPGLFLSDHTMAYLRLGVGRTSFSSTGVSATTVGSAHLGLGLQTSLSQNWDIRGEYIYTDHKTIAGIGSLRTDAATIGLLYKLC